MDRITTDSIRNVCLLGHSGSGKTSLAEAALFVTKAIDRMGKPTDGTTVCDYDPEEVKRGFSLYTAIAPVMWKNKKINFIDTPGYFDFVGEVYQALRVADSAVITVDAKAGVEVGTELAWDYASDAGIPKAFFVNKSDDPEANFSKVLDELKEKFGISVCPLIIPMAEGHTVKGFINLASKKSYTFDKNGKYTEGEIPAEYEDQATELRSALLETAAENSEELMEKFFADEEISEKEVIDALRLGIKTCSAAPVIFGSATNVWCVEQLLSFIADTFPSFHDRGSEKVEKDGEIKEVPIEENGTTSIFVFKTIADPFVGKMSFFKVMNGMLTNEMSLRNVNSGSTEKFGHIYTIRGKKQTEVDALSCGDIGMTAKLSNTNTNDTLTASSTDIVYKKIVYPEPYLGMAVTPKAKGDEDKISSGIAKLLEEDYTIRFENNVETKQLVVYGLGDIHLDVFTSKLKSRFNVNVELTKPKIAYRETIKKTVQAEGKHKKQTGGHGQYGHVKITFSPGEAEGLTFTESVVGGAVPKNFFPAIEKGLLEAMQKGVLAGYPVVHLAANLYDGSYHEVDSSEMAFKIAASLAYKDGLPRANPVLLEPVGELKVYVPDSLVGDVIGDLNKRRGRVLGMTAYEGKKGYQLVEAEVPKAEMLDYPTVLRAMTQGRGWFTYKFVRYEECPAAVAQKVIAEAKQEAEKE
ncbi:MAG TPA: elongation factor G [Bacillota bacterium]|nr:elongation factor G [Bacillota bacterium]